MATISTDPTLLSTHTGWLRSIELICSHNDMSHCWLIYVPAHKPFAAPLERQFEPSLCLPHVINRETTFRATVPFNCHVRKFSDAAISATSINTVFSFFMTIMALFYALPIIFCLHDSKFFIMVPKWFHQAQILKSEEWSLLSGWKCDCCQEVFIWELWHEKLIDSVCRVLHCCSLIFITSIYVFLFSCCLWNWVLQTKKPANPTIKVTFQV